MKHLLLSTFLLSVTTAALKAQTPAPAAPPRPVTTWEAVDQPMSALLNGGHRIISATGPSFTLERSGKYVACEVRPAGGMRGTAETTSQCYRLN
ncbi:hypothetical protein [Muricoccus aerilatus]|uniref:hypothetical protein n=1 Tax=Muricoccus aerilatus TaxID=452982 RepID=UPI0005C20B8D|nr:hypothetical protein [Roseomonas aerilata]